MTLNNTQIQGSRLTETGFFFLEKTQSVFENNDQKSAPVKKGKIRNEAMTFKVIQYLQKWIQMF